MTVSLSVMMVQSQDGNDGTAMRSNVRPAERSVEPPDGLAEAETKSTTPHERHPHQTAHHKATMLQSTVKASEPFVDIIDYKIMASAPQTKLEGAHRLFR